MSDDDQLLIIDADRAVWREVGDEVVILDVPTATYLSLNGSAKVLWTRLDEGASEAQLVATIVESYGVKASQAERDVKEFLAALWERALITSDR